MPAQETVRYFPPTRTRAARGPAAPTDYLNPLPAPPAPARPSALLWGWGSDADGQLGTGAVFDGTSVKPRRNPVVEAAIRDGAYGAAGAGVEAIAAGGMHSLFVDERGTVWSFGVNDEGALGRVTGTPHPADAGRTVDDEALSKTPHPVQALVDEGFRAVRVAAGDNVSAAISDEGEFRVWGSFRDSNGFLGFSGTAARRTTPVALLELPRRRAGGAEKAVDVAVGNNHLLVLTTHGAVYAFGNGEDGQLGRRVPQRLKLDGTVPERVVLGARGTRAVAIGAGSHHSFAVDEDGGVWAWGLDSMGQTGTRAAGGGDGPVVQLPRRVVGLSRAELGGDAVAAVAGGDHHTLFLTAGGAVHACGATRNGQLGLAADDPALAKRASDEFVPTPARVAFPDAGDPVVQVSVGTHNNLAVTAGGALYAWGQQNDGELGIGEEPDTDAATPTVVVRPDGSWFALVAAAGGQHALGLFRKR